MVKQTIRIYCRIKPTKQNTGLYDTEEDDNGNSIVSFNIPKDLTKGIVNNKKEVYRFRFDNVFEQSVKQEEVFEAISVPVIDNVLAGYNGTIFAYGQTGSGKTFTITGGAERYNDRGIIPRALSYIFAQYEMNSSYEYTTHVSYLEIYNENGYDLLDPRHEATKLEDLPKVNLLEDNDGNIHLRNLSVHSAANEEEALNFLFLGDTNRMIAETPMNQASTRSHCIFTIHITAKDPGSAKMRRSKLHLVDLAGSERVSKTGVGGTLLAEAKYINLSLHYLEQVIIALSEKSRSHIPYRNSMMTSVLRDSLGGNCMTSMVATCSVEKRNIDESISTCRFAQRVAMIKNDAVLNEEVDPKLMIFRLKREIEELKNELAMSTGVEYTGVLTDDDKSRLKNLVHVYLEDADEEATLSVGADMRKINYCFLLLKIHYKSKLQEMESLMARTNREAEGVADRSESNYLASVGNEARLKELILQRDNEINILVGMLKKEKKNTADARRDLRVQQIGSALNADAMEVHRPRTKGQASFTDSSLHDLSTLHRNDDDFVATAASDAHRHAKHAPEEKPSTKGGPRSASRQHSARRQQEDMSVARQEAFEIFKRDYSSNAAIHEKKRLLKEKYTEARTLGEQVNQSRKSINTIKSRIEQQRIRHSMQGLTGDVDMNRPDEEEKMLRELMNKEKALYRDSFNNLKAMKTEIEHLQHLLEVSKVQMQKDFETWWSESVGKRSHENNAHISSTKTAWRTPPDTPERPLQEILQNARRKGSKSRLEEGVSDAMEQYPNSKERVASLSIRDRSQRNDSGKFASRLRAEAQLASSMFTAQQDRSFSLSSTQVTHNMQQEQANASGSQEKKLASGIRLTGDSRTDAEIIAFMKAREKLLENKGGQS
eukprot:gene20071-22040_t